MRDSLLWRLWRMVSNQRSISPVDFLEFKGIFMAEKLRVGVIGLGAIGKRVLHSFARHPQTIVCAISDVDADRIATTANELDNEVFTSTDYHDILTDNRVDLVYVAVPPMYHAPIVFDVLQAGKH